MIYLLVFLGGGIGSALRHAVNVAAARLLGIGFPFGTITVNILGSLIIGILAGYFAFGGAGASQHARVFLTTGVLGGFTTLSAFSLDVALLYERGQLGIAAAYLLISLVFSIGGLFLGLWFVRQVT